jgi:hypothetical protein
LKLAVVFLPSPPKQCCKAMGIAPNKLGRNTLEGRTLKVMGGTM